MFWDTGNRLILIYINTEQNNCHLPHILRKNLLLKLTQNIL